MRNDPVTENSLRRRPFGGQIFDRMAKNADYPVAIQRPAYGAILHLVRTAILRCPDRYTIKDVQDALLLMEEQLTQASVADAIQRLLRKQEIHVAKRGKGGKRTTYKQ